MCTLKSESRWERIKSPNCHICVCVPQTRKFWHYAVEIIYFWEHSWQTESCRYIESKSNWVRAAFPTNYKHCGFWTQQPQKRNEHRWHSPGEWIIGITRCQMIVCIVVTFFYKSQTIQSTQPGSDKFLHGWWQCWMGKIVFLEDSSCCQWIPGVGKGASLRNRVLCKSFQFPLFAVLIRTAGSKCFR